MKYLFEFLFKFVVIAALMFFFTALFGVWTDAERLPIAISFGLGASLVSTVFSVAQNKFTKKK